MCFNLKQNISMHLFILYMYVKYSILRRLNGHQIIHQVFLKFELMFKSINRHLEEKTIRNNLALKFRYIIFIV